MSGLFQQVMSQLGIQQFTSMAYHPQSQERFHQTLKNMMRTYCFEEKIIRIGMNGVRMLFSVRESVN